MKDVYHIRSGISLSSKFVVKVPSSTFDDY